VSKAGFRSGLERQVASSLIKKKVAYTYEENRISYLLMKTYTPDFYLKKQKIFLEVKGYFLPSDRTKHLKIKEQHPEIDIRFVFGNARNRLNKRSKTTYGAWCDKHGFLWSDNGQIPAEWLK